MAKGFEGTTSIGFDSLVALIVQNADGMVVIDEEGRALLVNPAAERLLGRTSDELLGEVFGYPVVEGATSEVDILRGDGGVVVAEMRVGAVRWAGQAARLATLRDATERKRQQAHLAHTERMASVGTLAAGVAHEVNNPLTYVMFNLQMLEQSLPLVADAIEAHLGDGGEKPGPLERALPEVCRPQSLRVLATRAAQATEGARRIRDIVRTLTSFSRRDADRRAPVDVRAAAEIAIQMAHNEIKYRAQLVRDFAPTSPVLGDGGAITQVVLNLLINSAQAIPEGQAAHNEIAVRTFDNGDDVVIEVRDTGAGIPRALLNRVFEPFFTTKPPDQGSGLGLSICHNIVEATGGRIDLESTPGRGTCVAVHLPKLREPVTPPASSATRSSEPPLQGSRPRVLVVDDEPLVASTVEALLSREFDVVVLDSGAAARRLLQRDPAFDVIVCDLLMPDVSGMDVYEWMQSDRPELCERILFMTGGAFTERATEFLESVAGKHIEKPFDVRVLLSRVRRTAKLSG